MTARLFTLHRAEDPTGVSGTGVVADGVEFDDDVVVLHWRGKHRSTTVWANLQDALAVHGHGGATRVVWRDGESRLQVLTAADVADEINRLDARIAGEQP